MGRAPCCDKANVKKGPWSPEEDAKLKTYIQDHGTGGNWIALPQKIGLRRCGKSCRLRWLNYLRPNIKHGGFSEEEDNIICSLFLSIGSRWSIIAAQLPGRTDNDIKNYWNTKLKKKLMGKQRKAGQILARRQMIKRESTTTNETTLTISNSMMNPIIHYYPELPVYAPTLDSTLHDPSNDQVSISKLLVNLGGIFYDDDHQQPYTNTTTNIENPLDYYFPYQDLLYCNSMNSFSPTNSISVECSNMDQVFKFSNESSSGVEIVNCKSGNSSIESSSTWRDINSIIYDPGTSSNYEAFQ